MKWETIRTLAPNFNLPFEEGEAEFEAPNGVEAWLAELWQYSIIGEIQAAQTANPPVPPSRRQNVFEYATQNFTTGARDNGAPPPIQYRFVHRQIPGTGWMGVEEPPPPPPPPQPPIITNLSTTTINGRGELLIFGTNLDVVTDVVDGANATIHITEQLPTMLRVDVFGSGNDNWTGQLGLVWSGGTEYSGPEITINGPGS